MQKKTLTIKQYLGMIVLFLFLLYGSVALSILSNGGVRGPISSRSSNEYDALLASMNTEPTDTTGDYYDLLLTMDTDLVEESGE